MKYMDIVITKGDLNYSCSSNAVCIDFSIQVIIIDVK